MPPLLTISNRQRTIRFDTRFILRMGEAALPHCLEAICRGKAPLKHLEEVEIALLSDGGIARVHGEFFDDPTPTDVITFDHGEILLGAGTVRDNARHYRQTASEEAARCVIHGLLHLGGWEDGTARQAKEMARVQEQIFKRVRKVV